MKLTRYIFLLLAILAVGGRLHAQGTAFTYQGRLNAGASPAAGIYDLTFRIYDLASGGSAVGEAITNAATSVSNGLFTVTLDFGAGVFPGPERWLEIAVRTNGGASFAPLTPRQRVSSTPYAITAGTVTGPLSSSALSGVYSNAVTFSNAANQFTGTFTGNGGGLSNVNAQSLGGLTSSAFWKLQGNNVAPGQFLGSTNDQPIEIRVNGQQAMRYESTFDTPNVVGGWSGNFVSPGIPGVTIGGGGSIVPFNGNPQPNVVTSNGHYATIAGGYNNTVKGYGGAIGGGSVNSVVGDFGFIGGGQFHTIDLSSSYSVIAGGFGNILETNAQGAFIAGGGANVIRHNTFASSIGGGYGNTNGATYGVIGGGLSNTIEPNNASATIGGGERNVIRENVYFGFIGGGNANIIQPGSGYSEIAGGWANTIEGNGGFSIIGSGQGNVISNTASHAGIVGGTRNIISGGGAFIGGGFQNRAENFDSTVGGGAYNANSSFRGFIGAGENNSNASPHSFIGAGYQNVLEPFTDLSVIGGGLFNYIHSGADQSVVAGGNANRIFNGARESFVGGGFLNIIQTNSAFSTIGAGTGNTIGTNSLWATMGGGDVNIIQPNASYATIAGGQSNTNAAPYAFLGGGLRNSVEGFQSIIGGGRLNSISANANWATIGGGDRNVILSSSGVFIGGGARNTVGSIISYGTIAGGWSNSLLANLNQPTIGGGLANTIHTGGDYSFIGGGALNTNHGFISLIAGGRNNTILPLADHSVIGGGRGNRITGSQLLELYATIGGGQGNTVLTNAPYATIPGGFSNAASAYSFAAGNRAKAIHQGSFVWADSTNADFVTTTSNQFLIRASGGVGINTTNPTTALEVVGTVKAGGFMDNGSGFSGNGGALTNVNAATLGGLRSSNFWQLNGNNVAAGQFLGSTNNRAVDVRVNNQRALRIEPTAGAPNIIGGADVNAVAAGVTGATIDGGLANTIGANSGLATVGGGQINVIGPDSHESTIGGGYRNTIETFDSTIGGGAVNTIQTNSSYSTIAGGTANRILDGAQLSTIGGGSGNVIDTNATYSTIGGGTGNRIDISAASATIGGGENNRAGAKHATVAGGGWNTASGISSFIGGGGGNSFGGPWPNTASGNWSAILGGWNNSAGGYSSAIGGGSDNVASGSYGTIPGGSFNRASGDHSFAAGYFAKADHPGSFVWADGQNSDFASTADNQFSIRASGGVRLNTDTSLFFGNQTRQMLNLWGTVYGIGVQNSAAYFRTDQEFMWYRRGSHSDTFGDPGAGGTQLMRLGINGELIIAGTLSQGSDRNIKQDFTPLDVQEVLRKVASLPIRSWAYTNDPGCRHVGPIAQDFHAAFGLNGNDDKHIATVDADGVALAAIQGLNQKLEEQLAKKDAEIDELKRSVEELKELVLSARR